jgi:hypothetical protein
MRFLGSFVALLSSFIIKCQADPSWFLYTPTTNHGGEMLIPGDTLTVIWSVSDSPGWDSCTVAIRSYDNPDLTVSVLNPHPQCGAGSIAFLIPQTQCSPWLTNWNSILE